MKLFKKLYLFLNTIVFCSFALILTMGTLHANEHKTYESALEDVNYLYYSMNQLVSNEYEHYFISFAYNENAVAAVNDYLETNDECTNDKDFTAIDNKLLVESIGDKMFSGFEYLSIEDSRKIIIENTINESLKTLLEELNKLSDSGKKITTCTNHKTPAYSDGHEMTLVKIDNKLSFIFEAGRPD